MTTGLGRAHDGPEPGTYLITVELPPGTDPDKWNALMKVCGNIAHKYIPGAYVHGSRVMESRGRHGGN